MSQNIKDILLRAHQVFGSVNLTQEEQFILSSTLMLSAKLNKDAAEGLCGAEAQAVEFAKLEADYEVVLELTEKMKSMGLLSGPALPPSPQGEAAMGFDVRSFGEPGRKMAELMLGVHEKCGMDQATLAMMRESIAKKT